MEDKLKIQIWSDIMCPFCYIGKRRLESAMDQFEHSNLVEIEWKSFQLDPNFIANKEDSLIDHLAEKYRKNREWAKESLDNMTQNAKNSGLEFHFENAILANSFNAHRLLQYAKTKKLGNQLKELLFKAYLTDGKNIDNLNTLAQISTEIGLDETISNEVLHSNAYANEVKKDIEIAQNYGIQGVPFFIFDNKYAISGAQHVETFKKTLEKAWEEGNFKNKMTLLHTNNQEDSCGIEGCD